MRRVAHLPSGRFGANSAWALCAVIAHNLLRATGTLAGKPHPAARGATLRRKIVTIPALPPVMRTHPTSAHPLALD